MVGSSSSKILTVSYGTFSCTLEGFDDPFSTMRHIAEYFRDLAADDRYFGAEPPTPDAEMLHRIAEREIQRRVEARVTGESVVLRQLDTGLQEDEADAPAAEVMDERAPEPAPWSEPEPMPEPVDEPMEDMADETGAAAGDELTASSDEGTEEIAQSAEPEAPEEDEDDAFAAAAARAGSIEEKLSRIRAVVERTRSRDLGAGLAARTTEESDADEEAMVADMSPGFAGDIDASLISQVMAEQEGDESAGSADEAPADEGPAWDFGEVETVEEAVVEEDTEETAPQHTEDHEDDLEARDDGQEPEQTETEAATEAADEGEEATDAAIARIMAGGKADAGDDETDKLSAEEAELEAETSSEIVLETSMASDDAKSAETDEAAELEDEIETAVEEAAAPKVTSGEEEEHDELWSVDFDAETAATEAETEGNAAEEPADEAEEEKGRALDLEADWNAEADAAAAPKDEPTLESMRAERTLSKSSQLRTPEEESARLESRTENAFAENESSRRRSAIAHLKAAVAATRADRILSKVVGRDLASDPEEQKHYREDLSKVVKSRPISQVTEPQAESEEPEVADETPVLDIETVAETAEDEAPADVDLDLAPEIGEEAIEDDDERRSSRVKTRLLGPEDTVEPSAYEYEHGDDEAETGSDESSSPLMLVSELRVETETGIQPRRVSRDLAAEDRAADADDKGFAHFADRVGATDLPDLMEAAAAYTAYVEGHPHFSRPQIMRRVAKIDPSIEDSREAGLRSFGQLLRQGRIVKLTRGQFTVAETTRFKPQQRIAGE